MLRTITETADGEATRRGADARSLPLARTSEIGVLRRERLHLSFETPEALRREFDQNIANGGLFVATDEPYSVRQPVTVEIELCYLRGSGGAECPGGVVELDGEIVHRVPKEMAAGGMVPGVALQLEESVPVLRERFVSLLGKRAVEEVQSDQEGPARRSARRGAVRAAVRVIPSGGEPFEATSRDLSHSGILITVHDRVPLVDQIVRLWLRHPSGEPQVSVDGKVVREVRNKAGRPAAVAIAFDRSQAADPSVRTVIDALQQAGHRSQLGGISGALNDLGLANLLQMFGSSAPRGTLVVESEGEQGWIAFEEGQLLGARLGPLEGREALIEMLSWTSGRFHFEASAEERLITSGERRPLQGAVLDAVCELDEQGRGGGGASDTSCEADATMIFGSGVDGGSADPSGRWTYPDEDGTSAASDPPSDAGWADMDPGDLGGPLGAETRFDVDPEQEELSVGTLDKTEEAIVELARSGFGLARMQEIIPESAEVVQAAVEGLVELGVLRPL